jgi:FkbM family methyltransferase
VIRFLDAWLPDGEDHMQAHLRRGPVVHGLHTYQHHKYAVAFSHVKGRRRAVDAGAHCGLFARVMARDFDRVDAFEPVPAFQECFTCNTLAAGNVVLHRAALGLRAGQATMRVAVGNTGLSHLSSAGDLVVPLVALDDLDYEDLDFLKVDVEGWEPEVIAGSMDTLVRCRPVVMVEQNPGKSARCGRVDDAAERLLREELGARMVADLSGDLVFKWG